MTARQELLAALRAARETRDPGLPEPGPPERAGPYRRQLQEDLVGHFTRRAEELGVQVHRILEGSKLAAAVARLCEGKATYVEPALDFLTPALRESVHLVGWERLPEAQVGVTGADYGLAESGTLVLLARPARPRSGSLLPPVHVALLREDRILVDLFDLLPRLGTCAETPSARGERRRLDVLPTGLVLATGPSRSADIEMSLAVGVHGPGTVHVVLLPGGQEWPGGLAKESSARWEATRTGGGR